VVRTLTAGTEQILPLPPEVAQGGLPSTGHRLLYLADHDLWVSRDGRIPSQLATGLIPASWM